MDEIDWKDLLFSFEGRINRAKFWLGVVVIGVVPWVFMMLAFMVAVMVVATFHLWKVTWAAENSHMYM